MSRPLAKATFARGVGYVRVSTADQADNISTEVQEREIRQWMQARGVAVVEILKVDESGRYLDRAGLNRIRVLARARAFDVLVAYDQDRAFRSEYVRRKVEEEDLVPNGVEMRFCFEPDVLADKDRKMMRGLKGVQAEYYSDFVRERVTEAMIFKAGNGEWCGGTTPYGYKLHVKGTRVSRHGKKMDIKDLVPHEDEHRIIRFIKQIYADGASTEFDLPDEHKERSDFGMGTIAMILNRLGLRTRKGHEWTKETVARFLRDPNDIHLGTYTYNKTRGSMEDRRQRGTSKPAEEFIQLVGCFPPLVGEDLQRRCQAKAKANWTRAPQAFGSDYVLSERLLHCPCGSPMSGFTRSPDAKHKHPRRYYACSARRTSKSCSVSNIKADTIEPVVVGTVLRYLADPRVRDRILDYARGLLADRSGDREAVIESARRRMVGIDDQIKNVRVHLRDATDLAEVFYDDLRDLMGQKKDVEAHIKRLRMGHDPEERQRHLEAVEKMITGVDGIWEKATPEERKTILKGFVRKITLAEGLGTASVEIRVPVLFGELAEVVEVAIAS